MPFKIFLSFLILGLGTLTLFPSQTPIPRAPQSLTNPQQSSLYTLINGTDGCPRQVEWTMECQGFSLHPSESPLISGRQSFCHINRGTQAIALPSDVGSRRQLTTVTSKENLVHRKQTTVFRDQSGSLSLHAEDTLILDETGKLLWEHDQNNRGFSCLYAK